jgi:hypothetical protein
MYRRLIYQKGGLGSVGHYPIEGENISKNTWYLLENVLSVENQNINAEKAAWTMAWSVAINGVSKAYFGIEMHSSSTGYWKYRTYCHDNIHNLYPIFPTTSGNFALNDFKFLRLGYKVVTNTVGGMWRAGIYIGIIISDDAYCYNLEREEYPTVFYTGYDYSSDPAVILETPYVSEQFASLSTGNKLTCLDGPYNLVAKSIGTDLFDFANGIQSYMELGIDIMPSSILERDYISELTDQKLKLDDANTALAEANEALADANSALNVANAALAHPDYGLDKIVGSYLNDAGHGLERLKNDGVSVINNLGDSTFGLSALKTALDSIALSTSLIDDLYDIFILHDLTKLEAMFKDFGEKIMLMLESKLSDNEWLVRIINLWISNVARVSKGYE